VGKGNCSPTFFEEAEKGRYYEKFIGLLSAEIITGRCVSSSKHFFDKTHVYTHPSK
jgi:hypothetical protein